MHPAPAIHPSHAYAPPVMSQYMMHTETQEGFPRLARLDVDEYRRCQEQGLCFLCRQPGQRSRTCPGLGLNMPHQSTQEGEMFATAPLAVARAQGCCTCMHSAGSCHLTSGVPVVPSDRTSTCRSRLHYRGRSHRWRTSPSASRH